MAADTLPTSRSLLATHCLDVSQLAEPPTGRTPQPPSPRARGLSVTPRTRGAKWVEAAHTELGVLSADLVPAPRPGFAGPRGAPIGSAETAFMLAIDEDERQTAEEDRPARAPTPAMLMVAVPAARPRSPIAGQSESTTPATPPRPTRGIDPEAVRAVLSQPTAALLPALERVQSEPSSERVRPLQLATPPPKARAKSFAPTPRARARSFAGQLGMPVPLPPPAPPPALQTAPMSTAHQVVLARRSAKTRAVNLAAAILSGLAAAMAVMAIVVSV